MAARISALLISLVCVTVVSAQYPFYQTFPGVGMFRPRFPPFQRTSFVPLSAVSPPGIGGDYFGGVGGTRGLPIYGGAGVGERHSNGLDRYGRGLIPHA